MRLTIMFLIVAGCAGAANSQELVPPPVPTDLSQAANEASSMATQAASAASVSGVAAAGPGVGFKPGGFFHALSTTKNSICQKLKHSAIGGLVAEMRKPLSAITGGMVAPVAAPSSHEVAAAGPQGTAAQIQAIKIDAPKRVAAIAQLQGIDVRYHPEAAQTLIAALRADPSDCVRLEAARSIATLKTCTKPIAEALRICVEGLETDGNPAELSPAVQQQAAMALSCCLNCLSDSSAAPTTETRPEYPVTTAAFTTNSSNFASPAKFATLTPRSGNYYAQVASASRDQVASAAAQTLMRNSNLLKAAGDSRNDATQLPPGSTPVGLFEIWRASGR